MDELISKQSLLDAFGLSEKTRKWGGDHSGYNTMMLYEIQDVIESAPPVNPQEPSGDAVSRQAVFDLCGTNRYDLPYNTGDRRGYDEGRIINMTKLKLLPSVTTIPSTEPKTGHWIAQDIHNCHTDFKCSECGYIHNFMHLYGEPTADYTYCPACGARMVEPQESEDNE